MNLHTNGSLFKTNENNIASGELDSAITQQNSGLFRPLAVTHNYFPGNREAGLADSFSPLTF
jgi:hypothetical protein